ncbi:hypothetical protein PHYBLDRAFT_165725 [Phycomyces blakesleeanus NRRL 1555(-)]|uniref:Uncharacterized protein n=1 Tax=Phycomyces blakesleeanus (strain ATCC 8743b / DSM 1359 / FGSC 10004 / NBRC 33097 / NRRL 1555) TaxID=763407 RepID=A0A167P4K8_PHYB8|nr:hypothetical protein PHYBLDRAFT_165725 [Phycomyces blakesleeanus NRRL 1555(-)]OAD77236.1 hypothetical protein PHYBLDRAFT_165725 [Phycomyces blakesleeanus NRRL 1555(-)]|eukprot:XP_018295276.1 hypothetical protein PHYBLDRAFT_165725 [Phycomyces blakesleeanus NRRL 1555(-)]
MCNFCSFHQNKNRFCDERKYLFNTEFEDDEHLFQAYARKQPVWQQVATRFLITPTFLTFEDLLLPTSPLSVKDIPFVTSRIAAIATLNIRRLELEESIQTYNLYRIENRSTTPFFFNTQKSKSQAFLALSKILQINKALMLFPIESNKHCLSTPTEKLIHTMKSPKRYLHLSDILYGHLIQNAGSVPKKDPVRSTTCVHPTHYKKSN